MFDLEEQITGWRAEIASAGLHDSGVLDELEAHLREQIDRLHGIGLSEQEKFQVAIGRLGEVRAIKQEFSKVNHLRLLLPLENPAKLNIAGIIFILSGLNVIFSVTRLSLVTWLPGTSSLTVIVFLMAYSLFGLQFFVGVGLLYRRNFWRLSAFALGVPNVIYSIYMMWTMYGISKTPFAGGYFPCMGAMVPMRFHWIPDVGTIGTVVWACVYLGRSSVQGLFRQKTKLETVSAA